MVSQYLALLHVWCVDHSKGENYRFMTNIPGKFVFYIVPATYNCLSESILLRCTKQELQELSSPVPHRQPEQFSLKSMKEIYIPAKIINPSQFVTDPLKTLRIIIHMHLHPVSSELENSGIRVTVDNCSVTEHRRWRPPYQTSKTVHVHAKHYKHNEDGRPAPGVCGNGSVPLSHSGNVVTRIGIHTHTSTRIWTTRLLIRK